MESPAFYFDFLYTEFDISLTGLNGLKETD